MNLFLTTAGVALDHLQAAAGHVLAYEPTPAPSTPPVGPQAPPSVSVDFDAIDSLIKKIAGIGLLVIGVWAIFRARKRGAMGEVTTSSGVVVIGALIIGGGAALLGVGTALFDLFTVQQQ